MTLLEANNLRKTFGGIVAVDDVSFEVDRTEIVGVIGPNGAGKSTMFKLLAGFHKPDEGTVVFDGEDVTEFTISPANLGLDRAPIEAVAGGTPEENAADLRGIVDGSVTGPKRDLILANAGAAIYVAGEADPLAAGVERAAEAIDSGAAAEKFAALCGDGAPAEGPEAATAEDDD